VRCHGTFHRCEIFLKLSRYIRFYETCFRYYFADLPSSTPANA
jgi:hypothetical protein